MQQPASPKVTAAGGVKGGDRLSTASYGSDLIVDMLRALDIPYAALNPGASFRGLHDSLVHFDGGTSPEILLCMHEEIAVALAHGYALATGRPMAAILHNIVGLQHGTMAIFNAWCDRVPVMVLGGTGPMNTQTRRPRIDWIHTALVQGNQVRDYVKWDDQPASVEAIPESMLRAWRTAMTEPHGPVYVCFDSDIQEQRIEVPITLPNIPRFAPPGPAGADQDALEQAAVLLVNTQHPVIIAESVGRDRRALSALRELAELLAAPVIDRGGNFSMPTTHPMNLTLAGAGLLREADVILALGVGDLEGALGAEMLRTRQMPQLSVPPGASVIHITMADYLQRAWAADYSRLVPVDIPIAASPTLALPALVTLCRDRQEAEGGSKTRIEERRTKLEELQRAAQKRAEESVQQAWSQQPISSPRLHSELQDLVKGRPWAMTGRGTRGIWEFTEPGQQLTGSGGGGGLGFALPGAIGKALAHKGTGRLCINVQGDGDFLFTPSALWTAAHHQIPLLTIVWNNRSYYQDEGHQEHMAAVRERANADVGMGIHLREPDVDFVSLAKAFDVEGFGPVTDPDTLRSTLEQAIRVVDQGRPAVVDVISQPR